MKAKDLNWVPQKSEVYEEFSLEAEINVLLYNKEPAYYKVTKILHNIMALFYVGNTGYGLKHWCESIEEAKQTCQKHYDSIIKENAKYEE